MILKLYILLGFTIILCQSTTTEEPTHNVEDVRTTEATTSDIPTSEAPVVTEAEEVVVNVPGKGEKLEEEIEKIGKDMQPETVTTKQTPEKVKETAEPKINEEMDLKKNLENLTINKTEETSTTTTTTTTTTEIPVVTTQETVADGEGLEHDEQGEVEDSDNDLTELEEKDRKTPTEDVEASEATTTEPNQETSEASETPKSTEKSPDGPIKTKQFKNQEPAKEESLKLSEVSDGMLIKTEENKVETDIAVVTDEPTTEEENDKWIAWDLIHFLLLLSPYDEDEITWWTIIYEAVKCSLRNCPNVHSHWYQRPVYLPRISRHRRQDSDFSPDDIPPTKSSQPCPCRDIEGYFEKLYASINEELKKKQLNSTM
ncbi:hypothetical protein CRE_15757 [Caenorhabditis remanei]|uniref:Uncharacterized protein n=1 Tax=Caenorhabditis remanei TaxID=31234 RepID=E3NIT6_CAERE|nr:hypothetical protein CRE_15757 [Caenorhabditis remanei]